LKDERGVGERTRSVKNEHTMQRNLSRGHPRNVFLIYLGREQKGGAKEGMAPRRNMTCGGNRVASMGR